ncbi:MAG: hypothetical protein K2H92_08115 [Bacteroidaceae bacterium]|nr:hypothetical protein [Bacteroidaceae bacterium]
MSPTSTNRSPRRRLVGVGDSDFVAVNPCHISKCPASDISPFPFPLMTKETFSYRIKVRLVLE